MPAAEPTGDASLKAVAKLLDEVGSYVGSLADGAADDAWEAHEVAELRYHAERVISKVLGIVAGAEQAMEASHG